MDAQDEDARIVHLTQLLEDALDLATQADASERLFEISRLCREAAELAAQGRPPAL